MKFIIGLGNPGIEYQNSRHNAGRFILEQLNKKLIFTDWSESNKAKALISEGKIGKEKVTFILPNNFMNNSGTSVKYFIKNKKELSNLIVFYDDLDLPIGRYKISFNKSSGGHNGLGSIINNLKATEFIRFRIGISSTLASGKIKKPQGEKRVVDFLMKDFKDEEVKMVKNLAKKILEALEMIFSEGKDKAMSIYNK